MPPPNSHLTCFSECEQLHIRELYLFPASTLEPQLEACHSPYSQALILVGMRYIFVLRAGDGMHVCAVWYAGLLLGGFCCHTYLLVC